MSQPQKHIIVVGTSEPQDFEVRNDGVALDGTGYDVALEITQLVNGVATPVSNPPTANWLTAATGKVRVTGVESLAIGNYLVRFRVTDGGNAIGFFPNGDKADLWRVVDIPAR